MVELGERTLIERLMRAPLLAQVGHRKATTASERDEANDLFMGVIWVQGMRLCVTHVPGLCVT